MGLGVLFLLVLASSHQVLALLARKLLGVDQLVVLIPLAIIIVLNNSLVVHLLVDTTVAPLGNPGLGFVVEHKLAVLGPLLDALLLSEELPAGLRLVLRHRLLSRKSPKELRKLEKRHGIVLGASGVDASYCALNGELEELVDEKLGAVTSSIVELLLEVATKIQWVQIGNCEVAQVIADGNGFLDHRRFAYAHVLAVLKKNTPYPDNFMLRQRGGPTDDIRGE